MKSAFIRMMAVAVFATSISVFAASENPKPAKDNNSGSTSVGTAVGSNDTLTLETVLEKLNQLQAEVQQLNARDKEREREQQINQEDIDKMIEQQDKHWNDSLLGMYGG
jgi:TolA-binding protein